MDFDSQIAKKSMWIKYEPKSFYPSILDTSCELLAKYEVIRAKTLLNRNEKPQNSIMLGLWEPKIDDFDSQIAKNRGGSNMRLNPVSLVF